MTTKVFQIGAAGGVGTRLSKILCERGDEVTGLHRAPDQAERISATGAAPLLGDIISWSDDELAEAMRGHDAIVFSAGAHGTGMDQTTLIDGEGVAKSVRAALAAGVPRFVLVSVFPEAGRQRERSEGFEHYIRVKKSADVALAESGLDWVIVRPGRLLNDVGTGRVRAGLAVPYGDIARDDVAAFIAAVLAEPRLHREVVEVVGGDAPIPEAVAALVRH